MQQEKLSDRLIILLACQVVSIIVSSLMIPLSINSILPFIVLLFVFSAELHLIMDVGLVDNAVTLTFEPRMKEKW